MAEFVVDFYSEHDGVRCEEVVRCKDCDSATDHYEGMDIYWCDYISRYVGADMFCAWGVRRADG